MMHAHTDKLSAYISFVSVLPWRPATASSASSGKLEHAWHGIAARIDVGDGRYGVRRHVLGSSSRRSERGEKLGDMPGSLYATRIAASS